MIICRHPFQYLRICDDGCSFLSTLLQAPSNPNPSHAHDEAAIEPHGTMLRSSGAAACDHYLARVWLCSLLGVREGIHFARSLLSASIWSLFNRFGGAAAASLAQDPNDWLVWHYTKPQIRNLYIRCTYVCTYFADRTSMPHVILSTVYHRYLSIEVSNCETQEICMAT